MKYIRTKDGRIIDLTSKQISSYEIVDDKKAIEEYGEDSGFIMVYYYNRDIGEHIEYDNKGGRSMDSWYLKDIIKQADTIEELCDEYVIVNNADEKPFRLSVSVAKELEQRDETGNTICQGTSERLFDLAKSKLENIKKFVGNKKKHDKCVNYLYEENPDFVFEGTIKGAIWTDKGLIYVAKMNDKGELELL